MIKNIIFDIGGVLVDFVPQEAMKRLGIPESIIGELLDKTVNSKWWIQLDIGIMSEEEVMEQMINSSPEYGEYIRNFFYNGKEMLVKEFDYSRDWILQLKKRGYKIYLLSNYPKNYFTIHSKQMSFIDAADGMVISGFVNMIKPQKEIYNYILEKYDIEPEESIFIDDRMDNVTAAKKAGIRAIRFTDYDTAREKAEAVIRECNED